jgi:hypothetical protein
MKKNTKTKQPETSGEMRSEYDFTGGVRGKHIASLQEGYTIKIYKTDGTVVEKSVGRAGSVTLEPDVRKYFPTSKAVNKALRTLISLVPQKNKTKTHKDSPQSTRRKLLAKSRSKKNN